MTRTIVRTVSYAAAAAALCVVLLLSGSGHQAVSFDMAIDAPPAMTGVYRVERDGGHPFVWTEGQAGFNVPGLDRRVPWFCTVRFRGARPDASTPEPDVAFLIDGITVLVAHATNDYQAVTIQVPSRPAPRGMALVLVSTPTFKPGPSDPRQLGVQLDLFSCAPTQRATPPLSTTVDAAVAAAAFGASVGWFGVGLVAALLAIGLVASGLAFAFVTGLASYGTFPSIAAQMALWIAGLSVAGHQVLEAVRRKPLSAGARGALVATAVILFFNLIGLFHPSKNLEDVWFHAHRLEWVLSGRYFFTQVMPNGVRFPYAIGLYAFAAPWSVLTNNHVGLLRVVVCATNAIAGLAVYLMVVRAWRDSFAGAVAAMLFGVVPAWFSVAGNANLTNTFGQSVAVIALAAVVVCRLSWRNAGQLAALVLVVALAFLSHVSTISLLFATLVVTAVLFWWRGGAEMRGPAVIVLAAAIAAAILAVALYYGHRDFIPVYKALVRVQAPGGQQTTPISARTVNGVKQLVGSIGWPILLLAGIGAWRLRTEHLRDRLVLVIAASLFACVAFYAQNLLTRVDVRFERYAAEFLARVDDATYPALVMLAARGASWSWRAGRAGRAIALLLLTAALVVGARAWAGWL
jgi:hypothetical protein